MKALILLLLCSSVALSQDLFWSATYHHSTERDYLGIASSVQIIQINKVYLRAVSRGFIGTDYKNSFPSISAQRVEVGLEDKNIMITGESVFNILEYTYHINWLNNRSTNYSGSFGFGLGFHWSPDCAFTFKYVTGFDNGIRLSTEYKF